MVTEKGARRRRLRLWQQFGLLLVLVVVALLVIREIRTKRADQVYITTSGRIDMCLFCHKEEKLDPAHDPRMIGCASCHLGDGMAIDKEKAHAGMVINPGDLRVVEQTCGVEGCHPTDVQKVKNSLMATNRGIIGTLLFYWGESDSQDTDLTVEKLLAGHENSLALDYYRKLCATCHLWKQKNDLPWAPDFFNEKGGGCSACHFVMPEGIVRKGVTEFDDAARSEKSKVHPLVIKKVQDQNCIRCHNRSGRIGISYTGVFESEGYGTPYEKGGLSTKQLPGARFYLEIAEDVHHAKGLACIDCHTRNEIMGDGVSYAHYEDQLEISCGMCHSAEPGMTRKGKPVETIVQKEGKWQLTAKLTDKIHPLQPPKSGVCDFNGHKRVGCEACHSTWVPQCYGCHVKRDAGETHLDKLTLKETPGMWEEGRSYIRYEKPMLALWKDKVVIVTPGCQDIVTLVDKKGQVEGGFNRFTMAAINPHTTQTKGRSCAECHTSSKVVGLGEGTVSEKDGKWTFVPLDQGIDTFAGQTVGFDSFVTIDGQQLQHGSRPDLRPFNGEELRRILRVGLCVECHSEYSDPAWRNYKATTPCPEQKP
ncbi:MAG: amino acid ABC transporter substrate-binding protein [Desulfoarculaceae bacterium]|nr:amino acid ABC transporter substrate-binding protein [Desulfoarculaceae bacterium]